MNLIKMGEGQGEIVCLRHARSPDICHNIHLIFSQSQDGGNSFMDEGRLGIPSSDFSLPTA